MRQRKWRFIWHVASTKQKCYYDNSCITFLLNYIAPSVQSIKVLSTTSLGKKPRTQRREGRKGRSKYLVTWLTSELIDYCFHGCCKSQGSQTQGYETTLLFSFSDDSHTEFGSSGCFLFIRGLANSKCFRYKHVIHSSWLQDGYFYLHFTESISSLPAVVWVRMVPITLATSCGTFGKD